MSEILVTKEVYQTSGVEMQTVLDVIASCSTSEAICETWGSVIENIAKTKGSSNDGCSEDKQYGTIENRMMVMLNGPPAGYKKNDKLLKHSLIKMFGLNYSQRFAVKSSKFRTMSKVLTGISNGNHNPNRRIANNRLLSYFK